MSDAQKILIHLQLANNIGVKIYGAHYQYHMGMIWDMILDGMGWTLEGGSNGKKV